MAIVRILGAGAIGLGIASQMKHTGNEPEFICDAQRKERYSSEVFFINNEPMQINCVTPETIHEPADLIIVAVKYAHLDEAKELLETQYFDMAILDIMGVDGYKLLEIAKERRVIPVMLTAHALSPDNVVRSYKEGAASYVPKEEIANIATFLSDILEAREKGKNFWWRWFDRFASYFDRKFGPDWRESDKEFWENIARYGPY